MVTRIPVSELSCDKFSWLLTPSGVPSHAIHSNEELKEACLFLDKCWRILPGIMPRFISWIDDKVDKSSELLKIKQEAIALEKYGQLQNQLLCSLVERLNNDDLPYVLLKGSALRMSVYNNPVERIGGDIDIAISADHLDKCKSIVDKIGYKAVQWHPDERKFKKANPIIRKITESRHYELGFYVYSFLLDDILSDVESAIFSQIEKQPMMWFVDDNGKLGCHMRLDIHHGISHGRKMMADHIIEDFNVITVNNIKYSIPRPSWLLLHLIFKVYWEGLDSKNVLHHYADICRLITQVSGSEYKHFSNLIAARNLEIETYFVVRRLQSNLKTELPQEFKVFLEDISSLLKENSKKRNGRKDMWIKLWKY